MSADVDYEQCLAVLAEASLAEPDPLELFEGVGDDLWLWLNTEGLRRSPELRRYLPGLPDEDVQRRWTNQVGDEALLEGFSIYGRVRLLYTRHMADEVRGSEILDFGSGYGRVIRFFLRDEGHRLLHGTDHNESLVEFCRRSNRWCAFARNDAEPPAPFADGRFGLIYAYSVFSHFSEPMHLAWLEEFRRLLRPGGVLVLTVRPRSFIEYCARLRESEDLEDSPILRSMFPDTESELERYDSGGYCYSPYDSARRDAWWGEACISRGYIERVWGERLEFREMVPAGDGLKQHFVALRA